MATEDDKIRYSDIVVPDDSISKLIDNLKDLSSEFSKMSKAVKAGAKETAASLDKVSGATKKGRAAIDECSLAAARLEAAERELNIAITETGEQIAWLKAKTNEVNKSSVDHQKWLKQHASSYDRIKSDLKRLITEYRSLSESQRASSETGGRLLDTIVSLKTQLKAIDDSLKPHITALTEVQKAEQKLAFLRSEEGQRLLQLKQQINDVIAASRGEKITKDELAAAYEKLTYIQTEYYKELQNVNRQITEQARISKLQSQLNNSAVGSYNQLAAQYELNKIKLNAMSQEERRAVDIGQKLEAETRRIYQQMIFLQEATGNHKLSIGNYAKAWNGLGNAMNQIVREVPAMTMGINMFFLAISNNVPILIDELQRVQRQNQLLRAEGKPTENIIKTITSSIFGWQTALIALITIMSMYGKEIINWFKHTGMYEARIKSMIELHAVLAEEMEKTNGSYGNNIVSLRKLQDEWTRLTSDKEKELFVKNNRSEFDKLSIAVNNVTDAENVLIDNTAAVTEALRLRAKAAAAQKLAAEQYEKALVKYNEAEAEQLRLDNEGPSFFDRVKARFFGRTKRVPGAEGTPGATMVDVEGTVQDRINNLKEEAKEAENTAESYYNIAKAAEMAASAKLDEAGIKSKSQKESTRKSRQPRGRQPRDLTDIINRNDISIEKKYEESITKLKNDEYLKRKKALIDATKSEARELEELYRKNKTYLENKEGKYKPLTEEQKKQINQQQQWIIDTITNSQKKLSFDLEQLEKERQISVLKTMRETIEWRLEDIKDSINEERSIKLKQLDDEENLILEQNRLSKDGARDEAEIVAEYAKKRLKIIAYYDNQILALKKADIEAQLDVVKKGSTDELNLLLKRNAVERQLALSANRAKPAAEQQSESQINKSFDKKAFNISGQFIMTGFDEQQAVEEARFNIVKHSETEITKFKLEQERDRWIKQIQLAKIGALDWSEAQIKAAEYTVIGINRELAEVDNFILNVGKKGLGYSLLEKLGFDDDSIDALIEATKIVVDQYKAILDAEVELAEKSVELAEERVEAAQKAYDAEIEGRNKGYANNVETAKKELEQEKKKQQEKQRILEAAQRRREMLDSVTQASSLITASANLWSSFSGLGPFGPALAIAAIATMWTSFAAAKIKARQVATSSEEYGDGGLEFLEGGSHASGNDIDLHTRNRRKKNMRAEGGEALAIINKRNTKKYRRVLPGIIDSLNRGLFEDKYLSTFKDADNLNVSAYSNNVDLTKLEKEVSSIRKQNDTKYYIMPNGDVIIVSGNVKRIIRK